MKSILLAHAEKYPLMEPTDAVKLLYQSEFGGGHLIKDVNRCLDSLYREYGATVQIPGFPLTEDIGNGFVRVNLAALDAAGLSAEVLGDIFLRSAAQLWGTPDMFQQKLAFLRELTLAKKMPFSLQALEAYLTDYSQAGYPAVSHSAAYRSAYHPAYRVVRHSLLPEKYHLRK